MNDVVDAGLARLERALIGRGYRILYRRPGDHFIVTYQLQRDGATMGFRITDEVAAGCDAGDPIDRLEKEWHAAS